MSRSCPKTKTILLTQHEEDQYIREALEAGVRGYVLKSQAANDLVHAIQQVSRGQFYLSPGVSRAVVEAYRTKSQMPSDPLTVRERQVRSEEHTSELRSRLHLVCRLLLEKKKNGLDVSRSMR